MTTLRLLALFITFFMLTFIANWIFARERLRIPAGIAHAAKLQLHGRSVVQAMWMDGRCD
jgi:hypothetical protein